MFLFVEMCSEIWTPIQVSIDSKPERILSLCLIFRRMRRHSDFLNQEHSFSKAKVKVGEKIAGRSEEGKRDEPPEMFSREAAVVAFVVASQCFACCFLLRCFCCIFYFFFFC